MRLAATLLLIAAATAAHAGDYLPDQKLGVVTTEHEKITLYDRPGLCNGIGYDGGLSALKEFPDDQTKVAVPGCWKPVNDWLITIKFVGGTEQAIPRSALVITPKYRGSFL